MEREGPVEWVERSGWLMHLLILQPRSSCRMVPIGQKSTRHDPNQSSGDIGNLRQSNMSSRSQQGADM